MNKHTEPIEQWAHSELVVVPRRPRGPRGRECKLPFGIFLSMLVGVAAAMAAISIGALFFTAADQGNGTLARDLQNLTSLNVRQILLLLSLIPLENLLLLSSEIRHQTPAEIAPSSEWMRKLLYGHSVPLFDGSYVGFPDGRLMGYAGIRGELQFINATFNGNGAISLAFFSVDDKTGLPVAVRNTFSRNFKLKEQDWYITAMTEAARAGANATTVYTDMRIVSGCNCTGIIGALPVYVDGDLVAVAATHLRLVTISQALNATKIGNDGEAFILDEFGQIIGLSNPKRIGFSFSSIVPASSLDDPLLSDAVRHVLQLSGGNFSQIPLVGSESVTLAGRSYLLATMHFSSFQPRKWTIVIMIPRADYFSETDTALTRAIAIGTMIVVLIIVAMVFFSWLLLTLPLGRLSRGMDDIANSLQGPRLRKNSFIHEVSIMEKAYGNMATGLSSFSKYVPSPVVLELLKTSREPQVGVSTRECTFFFSDISDFTSISEATQPDLLNAVVSEYFSAMESILHGLNGITTDFLGDGLFVFWNAPIIQPDHAFLACEAALRQQEMMEQLRFDWQRRGLPEMHIRIGINTGSCLVGNFGSHNHLKYTVMGDAVNVASRLEQLNKQFGTSVMIGHETYRQVRVACAWDSTTDKVFFSLSLSLSLSLLSTPQVQALFVARPLALVTLKGKTESTRVYELVCRIEDATAEVLLLAKQSRELLDAYLHEDFSLALALCKTILDSQPDDVSTLYIRDNCVERFNSISSPFGHLRLRGGALMDLFAERGGLPFGSAKKSAKTFKSLTGSVPKHQLSFPSIFSGVVVEDWAFDAFLYTDDQLVVIVKQMFDRLDLVDHFKIDCVVLERFLLAVKQTYNNNPYHNWRHACDVAQATVSFLVQFNGRASLNKLDTFALLVAALCHDLDHPGVNNDFLIKTGSEMALLYNHQSVLENMHCCLLFKMLQCNSEINVFASLSKQDFAYVRSVIISCILATDLAAHGSIVNQVVAKCESGSGWSLASDSERLLLMKCIIKVADISNVARPWRGAGRKWGLVVTEEFFNQGDLERSMGLDVTRCNDRTATTLAINSVGFMDYVASPLFVALGKLHPEFATCVVTLLHENKDICKNEM